MEPRIADLTPAVGKTISQFRVAFSGFPGTWDAYYQDIVYEAADGTVIPLYNHNQTISLSGFGSSGVAQPIYNRDPGAGSYSQLMSTMYYHDDQIGSSRLMTSDGGWPVWQGTFLPYGEEYNQQITTNHYKFTGKERDSESALDYFGARYYGSALGRFLTVDFGGPMLSPDPVPWADLDSPQSLNLYSYVRSNPTSLDDPDGHDCVVQSRTGTNTENVSVSSGNCDNVRVGDGQTKTYVPGTVTGIKAGSDGKSIDIGYKPYDGSASISVFSASAAPIPQNTNLAYYWGNNAQGYRTLSQANTTVNMIAVATAVVSGGNLIMMAAGIGGTATLGDLTVTPHPGETAYAERLLAQGGKKAVEKAIKTLAKKLAEHEAKVGGLKYTSSVEREIATFTRTIEALSRVLGK